TQIAQHRSESGHGKSHCHQTKIVWRKQAGQTYRGADLNDDVDAACGDGNDSTPKRLSPMAFLRLVILEIGAHSAVLKVGSSVGERHIHREDCPSGSFPK